VTDQEVVEALNTDTPLSRARAAFSAACGRIEQAEAQRRKPTIFDIRRWSFRLRKRLSPHLMEGRDNGQHN
jgi:hypothetical protein